MNLKENRIKAQPFEIMQYFYSAVHKPLIHCLIHFSGLLDLSILKKAVFLTQESVPLIACRFHTTGIRPYWLKQNFTEDDFVEVRGTAIPDKTEERTARTVAINIEKGPQVKLIVLRSKSDDTLCIVMNHMVCDGAGMKEYLYLLCRLYNSLIESPNLVPYQSQTSRSAMQLFSGYGIAELLRILFSHYCLPPQKCQELSCFQGDKSNAIFASILLEKDEFTKVKGQAKLSGLSFNDLILAAYIRVVCKFTEKNQIVLPCPVDLRKYIHNNAKHAVTNLTSNYMCDITVNDQDSIYKTAAQISKQISKQKSSLNCLKSVILVETVFRALPYSLLKKVFHKIFTIPVLSYTNLGVVDKDQTTFGLTQINDLYLTGAVKHVPYFQIAVSTFHNTCTISSNLYGTSHDEKIMDCFLEEVRQELIGAE